MYCYVALRLCLIFFILKVWMLIDMMEQNDVQFTYQIDQIEYETYRTIIRSGLQNLLATPINECQFWSESTIQNKMINILNTALPKNCFLERYAGYWPDWMTEMETCMTGARRVPCVVLMKRIVKMLE